jgi:predicted metal-binding protein
MEHQHTVFVCQTCAGAWQDGKQVGNSGGYLLHQELTAQAQDWPLAADFHIQGVNCLGACNRPCAIALAAAGKSTYLFGDLNHAESLPEIATAILECASLYHSKPDGSMAWSERPVALKKGLVGRIPSIPIPVALPETAGS